jgi:hypothetical protein
MLFVKKNNFLFKINLYIYFQIVLMCYVKNNLKFLKIYIIFKQFFFKKIITTILLLLTI